MTSENAIIEAEYSKQESAPADYALLKIENEQLMSAARVHPRQPAQIVEQLQALIDAWPAAAADAIYSKPVGTVQRVTCGNDKCGVIYDVNRIDKDTACPSCDSKKRGIVRSAKKFADGLSIRAAESIRTALGYTRLRTESEPMPNGDCKIAGTIVDYAAGNMTSDVRIVSRRYKSASGHMTETPIDRFNNVVVKAEKAKLRRDLILDSTDGIIKAMFRSACEQKMADLVSPEMIKQKVVPAFKEFGIDEEELDMIAGRPAALGWRESERLLLRKILSALQSGETTAAELRQAGGDPTESVKRAKRTGAKLPGAKKPAESTAETPEPQPTEPEPAPATAKPAKPKAAKGPVLCPHKLPFHECSECGDDGKGLFK